MHLLKSVQLLGCISLAAGCYVSLNLCKKREYLRIFRGLDRDQRQTRGHIFAGIHFLIAGFLLYFQRNIDFMSKVWYNT